MGKERERGKKSVAERKRDRQSNYFYINLNKIMKICFFLFEIFQKIFGNFEKSLKNYQLAFKKLMVTCIIK